MDHRPQAFVGEWTQRTSLDYIALVSHASGGSNVADLPAMTVREVADYLNVDEKTVYRLAQRGQLPGFKVAGTWRFRKDDIDGWIEQQLPSRPAKTRGKSKG